MEKNSILIQYKKEIEKLEVSDEINNNINTAKNYMQLLIQNNKDLLKDDIINIMKEISEHFSFDKNSKQEFIEYCKNSYEIMEKQRQEENYQMEILKRAETSNIVDKIFPAIDYRENLGMIYGIKDFDEIGNEITYVGMANKKIYEINKIKNFGIIPTHEENIDSKFSLKLLQNT